MLQNEVYTFRDLRVEYVAGLNQYLVWRRTKLIALCGSLDTTVRAFVRAIGGAD